MFDPISIKRISLKGFCLLLTVTMIGALLPTQTEATREPGGKLFPFEGAKVVYEVGGVSPVGPIIGTLTYSVDKVTKSSYVVNLTTTGNVKKLPNISAQSTKKLEKGKPLFFSKIIDKSVLAGVYTLDTNKKEIKVDSYRFERKKELGMETITLFVPVEVSVPLMVNYSYGDEFQVNMELVRTNVKYLQVEGKKK